MVSGWGLVARLPCEIDGMIHDGSGDPRMGGGDVSRYGDIPCRRPISLEILARVRGYHRFIDVTPLVLRARLALRLRPKK